MARRRRRRLIVGVAALGLVLAACSPSDDTASSTTPGSSTSTTQLTPTTVAPPSATVPPATPTTAPPTTTTPTQPPTTEPDELPDLGATIRIPDGDGPFPTIVLVHGGGWVAGDPTLMNDLARFLTGQGYLTINAPYQLAGENPGFPQAVRDVSCAVNLAANHPDSDGTVALIGHSAGAHLSAVVALTGDDYLSNCPIGGSGIPDKFVGLAGPYDVDRLGLLMLPFFGGGPSVFPEEWLAGNPQRLTDENPSLQSLIMYGNEDGLVDERFAIDFHSALTDSGTETLLELVEGARHSDMRSSEIVGDLIVVWLER